MAGKRAINCGQRQRDNSALQSFHISGNVADRDSMGWLREIQIPEPPNEIGIQLDPQPVEGFVQLPGKPVNLGVRIPPAELKPLGELTNRGCENLVFFESEWRQAAHSFTVCFFRLFLSGRHGMRPGANSSKRSATLLSFLA